MFSHLFFFSEAVTQSLLAAPIFPAHSLWVQWTVGTSAARTQIPLWANPSVSAAAPSASVAATPSTPAASSATASTLHNSRTPLGNGFFRTLAGKLISDIKLSLLPVVDPKTPWMQPLNAVIMPKRILLALNKAGKSAALPDQDSNFIDTSQAVLNSFSGQVDAPGIMPFSDIEFLPYMCHRKGSHSMGDNAEKLKAVMGRWHVSTGGVDNDEMGGVSTPRWANGLSVNDTNGARGSGQQGWRGSGQRMDNGTGWRGGRSVRGRVLAVRSMALGLGGSLSVVRRV
ncbi:hypothetical protein DFH07DRAFT_773965 [Mycena maculata]|uniref:Uncharacterized protein n=1 Tax=Mycena maculata TaxID=230809 RepID=A0AAD7J2W8_9AGAR|nr:hypothetical protein DFH07DRAFT_773965 [Mycena maculata]